MTYFTSKGKEEGTALHQIQTLRQNKPENLILFADDNKTYACSINLALLKRYGADIVSNAKDLIEYAQNKEYKLIITDNDMASDHENPKPEEFGTYAIKQIRKFDKTTPIILSSGGIDEKVRKEAVENGVTEIIPKPIDLKGFRETIEKYLN